MKKIIFIILIAMFGFSCNFESADYKDRIAQEKLVKEGQAQTGMPAIVNFREKKLLKMILELRDQENLITYAYIVDLNAQLHFLGKCIGYGIPYSTQYSNPQKRLEYHDLIIAQADPNGLFSPASAEGTWLMLIDPTTNKPRPVYVEPRVIVSPFPLK